MDVANPTNVPPPRMKYASDVGWVDTTLGGVPERGYRHKIHVCPPFGEQTRWTAIAKTLECEDGRGDTREAAIDDLKAKMRDKINSFVGMKDPKTKHPTPMPVPQASISCIRTPGSEDAQVLITDAMPPYEAKAKKKEP